VLTRIDPDEAKWKLVRIENKKVVPGGNVQLNLHDGRNILLVSNEHRTGDVLKIELPSQKILAAFPQAAGSLALLTGGAHVGEMATVAGFEEKKNPMPNLVKFKEGFSTIKPYVFIIGVTTPEIKVPQPEALK
jgi:small subunit ribosomal protein S4e